MTVSWGLSYNTTQHTETGKLTRNLEFVESFYETNLASLIFFVTYTLFQNGRYLYVCILLFIYKLALVASFKGK